MKTVVIPCCGGFPQDLGNLRTIVRWVAWLEPDYNFGPVVEEWAKEVPKELDFRVEAQNLRDVSASLGGAPGASANGVGGLGCSECPRCGKHWAGPEGGVAEKAGAEGGSGEGEGGGQWQCECGYAISRARDRFAVDVELPQVRMVGSPHLALIPSPVVSHPTAGAPLFWLPPRESDPCRHLIGPRETRGGGGRHPTENVLVMGIMLGP